MNYDRIAAHRRICPAGQGKNNAFTSEPKWCKMVNMANKIKCTNGTIRSSISFSQNAYTSLEEIALEKRVSLAWVVRDAVETYLKEQKEGKKIKNV